MAKRLYRVEVSLFREHPVFCGVHASSSSFVLLFAAVFERIFKVLLHSTLQNLALPSTVHACRSAVDWMPVGCRLTEGRGPSAWAACVVTVWWRVTRGRRDRCPAPAVTRGALYVRWSGRHRPHCQSEIDLHDALCLHGARGKGAPGINGESNDWDRTGICYVGFLRSTFLCLHLALIRNLG